MDILKAWLNNYVLWSAIAGWIIAQLIKSTIDLIYKKKLTLKDVFFSSGGMPSSHSSTVMSLAVACAINDGLGSSTFAIAAVLAIVVMIDARGVRYETGEQAKILNRISRELFSGKPELMNTGGLLPHFFNSLSPDLVLPDFSKQGPLLCPLKQKPTHLQRGSPEVPECCHPD